MPSLSAHAQRALAGAAKAAGVVWEDSDNDPSLGTGALLIGFISAGYCRVVELFQDLSSTDAYVELDRAIIRATGAHLTGRTTQSSETQRATTKGPALPQRSIAERVLESTERAIGRGEGALNDRPENAEDRLEFSHYVKAFADLIESPDTSPPITIGIFGSWGAGKSFLLWHLQHELRRRARSRRPPLADVLKDAPLRDAPELIRRHMLDRGRDAAVRVWRNAADPIGHRMRTFAARWNGQPTPARHVERDARQVHSVTFNAWEYSATERIWPRLVRAILETVERDVRWTTRPLLAIEKFSRKLRYNLPRKLKSDWKGLVAWVGVGALLGFVVLKIPDAKTALQGETLLGLDLGTKFVLPSFLAGLAAIAKLFREMLLEPLGSWISALLDDGISYGGQIDYMAAIKADLDLLERRLFKARARVLIMIDDLDRCEPDKMMQVLQAVNLLLDRQSFVVCLGLDARIVTAAVEKHYKGLLGPAGMSGYEYLDKIIQIPFRIPDPSRAQVQSLLTKQLGDPIERERLEAERRERELFENQQGFARQLRDDFTRQQKARVNTPASERLDAIERELEIGELPTDVVRTPQLTRAPSTTIAAKTARQPVDESPLTFSADELRAFTSVAAYLRPNPRHIKRLVNVYALIRSLSVAREEHAWLGAPQSIVRWLVLAAQWPYAVRQMLIAFETLARSTPVATEDDPSWRPASVQPGEPALRHLMTKVQLDPELRRRFDFDSAVLDALVADSNFVSWNQLRLLRRYTLNFNPALDAELLATPRKSSRERRENHQLRQEVARAALLSSSAKGGEVDASSATDKGTVAVT
jgi:hypothetical protein